MKNMHIDNFQWGENLLHMSQGSQVSRSSLCRLSLVVLFKSMSQRVMSEVTRSHLKKCSKLDTPPFPSHKKCERDQVEMKLSSDCYQCSVGAVRNIDKTCYQLRSGLIHCPLLQIGVDRVHCTQWPALVWKPYQLLKGNNLHRSCRPHLFVWCHPLPLPQSTGP